MNKTIVAAVAGLVLVVVLALWGHGVYQERQARNAILELVTAAGERLAAGLKSETEPAGAGAPAFDSAGAAAAAEAALAKLRRMDASAMRALADAADDYLLTGREILRRLHDMREARGRLAASVPQLATHMKTDRGAGAWVNEAAQLRQIVDQDLRELRIATESYAELAASLPASQAKLAPHGGPSALPDAQAVKAARQAALDAYARIDENTRLVTRLENYRPAAGRAPKPRRKK